MNSGRVDPESSEIAFFGGSFTAIESEYMLCLLERANEYINRGLFKGVRISTRPDCISKDILDLLKKYGVSAIELGAQSMDDGVLSLNERGHSADDVRNASRLIKEYGFELGLQMMTGLYGSDDGKDIFTAQELIKLKPETVRIYPTVVLEGTRLAELMRSGEYKPQTLDEAVELCSELLLMYEENGIKVIRLGLHSGGNVEEGFLAGAYHPAFRELCESRIFLKKMLSLLENREKSKQYVFEVAEKSLSKALGQLKSNEKAFKNEGDCCIIKCNTNLGKYEIKLKDY